MDIVFFPMRSTLRPQEVLPPRAPLKVPSSNNRFSYYPAVDTFYTRSLSTMYHHRHHFQIATWAMPI